MAKRLSENDIDFQRSDGDCYGMLGGGNSSYHVFYDGKIIGEVKFTMMAIILTVGEIIDEREIPFNALGSHTNKALEYMKPRLIEMYHESKGDLFEDSLEFKHRDPANIGNGLHDYDVSYNGNTIGKLLFPNPASYLNSQSECVAFRPLGTSASFYTGMMADQYEKFSSNDEILDSLRQTIISIMIKNKIVYK